MNITLDKLPVNKTGKIINLNINNNLKRRLLDLGLINGASIKKLYKSPLNDPCSYLIKGSVIALRNNDTKKIHIAYDKTKKEGNINWD